LADEQDAIFGIDGDDRDGPGMAGDVPLGAAAVGPFDGVDPELEVPATMKDARSHDPLDEVLVVGRRGIDVGRGSRLRRRARARRVARERTGRAGRLVLVGQAATGSSSDVRLMPDSASKR
jgi:hypothetical protein